MVREYSLIGVRYSAKPSFGWWFAEKNSGKSPVKTKQ